MSRPALDEKIYQATSILNLVIEKIQGISSDDDILEVDMESANWSSALNGVVHLLHDIAGDFQEEECRNRKAKAAAGDRTNSAASGPHLQLVTTDGDGGAP